MLTYEKTKSRGLNNINKAVDLLKYSNNHEVNKQALLAILETTKEMLRLEDLESCIERNDFSGMHEAMRKEWT